MPPKSKTSKPKERKSKTLSEMAFSDLRFVVRLWKYVRAHRCTSVTKAYESAVETHAIPKVRQPKAIVNNVERYTGRKLFLTENKRVCINPDQAEFISMLERIFELLDAYTQRTSAGLRLRIGVGHSISVSIGPRIVAQFRKLYSKLAVEIFTAESVALQHKLEQARLDVVLTSLPFEYPGCEHSIRLSPALIANRHHPLAGHFREANNSLFDVKLLNKLPDKYFPLTVHVFEGSRPAIKNPHDFLSEVASDRIRYSRQNSFAFINEIVANSDDIGISLPHFFTNEQVRVLQEMPLASTASQVTVMNLLSIKSIAPESVKIADEVSDNAFSAALDCVIEIAKAEMNLLKEREAVARESAPSQRYRCYVFKPEAASSAGNAVWVWHAGSFRRFAGDSRYFSGEVVIDSEAKNNEWTGVFSTRLTVQGEIETNQLGRVTREMAICNGRDITSNEHFSVSFVGDMQAIAKEPLVGVWLGREEDSATKKFAPAFGFMILATVEGDPLSILTLENLVSKWSESAVYPRGLLAAVFGSTNAILRGPHRSQSNSRKDEPKLD